MLDEHGDILFRKSRNPEAAIASAHAAALIQDSRDFVSEPEQLYRKANDIAEEYVNRFPNAALGLDFLAAANHEYANWLVVKGRIDEAAPLYQKVQSFRERQLDGENQAVNQNKLSWLLSTCPIESLRDVDRALELAQHAADTETNGEQWDALGVAQYRAGKFDEALASFTEARRLHRKDRSPENDIFMAMTHWQRGDHRQAQMLYKEVAQTIAAKPQTPEVYLFMKDAAKMLETAVRP